ncbi:MAG: methylation-associated defense system AAA family ATPase MAD3 [Myxococcota bacterium]
MICLVEALNYRCLRYIRQPLAPFQVLVGPNASGKTTFLDVIAFMGDVVRLGPEFAIRSRTQNPEDLLWGRQGDGFELAIEATIPGHLRGKIQGNGSFGIVRYELAIRRDAVTTEWGIAAEKLLLKTDEPASHPRGDEQLAWTFPSPQSARPTLLTGKTPKNARLVLHKVLGGNDNFYSEVYREIGKGWVPTVKYGPRRSALGNLPAEEEKFPVTSWLRQWLSEGVQQLVLNSLLIRNASAPGQGRRFRPDGSNLPWLVHELQDHTPAQFTDWLAHLRTALPDLVGIRTVERSDDRHRYLMLRYANGVEVPSWMASDGTLRLMALTLPAYLPDFSGCYLIEEPENGIHPRAVEAMFQSLSSVYAAQMLLATHSPVILSIIQPEQLLCFAKKEGATDIVRGDEHPALSEWRGETNLSTLFAGGVLG